MMRTTLARLTALAGLLLLLEAGSATAQIFQWTDAKGVIHFTDNPYAIPAPIRNSPSLIVRKDLETGSHSPPAAFEARSVPENSSATIVSDANPEPTEPTAIAAPQEVNIVVVNSNLRPPSNHGCNSGGNCKPSIRPYFTDRRYIHPSVFDGSSRPARRSFSGVAVHRGR